MTLERLADLRARRDTLHRRWETLLRMEPVNGPLANPDTLVHMIPRTVAQIFAHLAKPSRAPVSILTARACLPKCDCGNNPYRAYFVAGEQAFSETAVWLQSALPASQRRQGDVAEIILAVRRIARSEIDTFCGACVHRSKHPQCRFREPAAV